MKFPKLSRMTKPTIIPVFKSISNECSKQMCKRPGRTGKDGYHGFVYRLDLLLLE